MVLNLIVLVFILGMAMMWATYGLYSSLLHLALVVVAGALAFALWEPLAYGVFFKFLPSGAWGVSLLSGFVVSLLLLRLALDRLVRGNLKVHRLADQIGGGALGAVSGLLTAGMTVIGLGFLPLPLSIAGYQPWEVQSNGSVAQREGGALWIPVDTLTTSFYNRLSGGAFSTRTPLDAYVPDVAKASSLFRLGRFYDENLSLVSAPGEVTANAVDRFVGDDLPGLDPALSEGLLAAAGGQNRLMSITTTITKGENPTTYDNDGLLRMPATNIRLATRKRGGPGQWVAPLGFTKPDAAGEKQFYPLLSNQIYASSTFPKQEITWHFVVPGDETANFLLVRNTRVLLPEAEDLDGSAYAALIGEPAESEAGAATTTTARAPNRSGGQAITAQPSEYANHKAVYIEQSASLPSNVSKNNAQFLDYEDGKTEVLGGNGTSQSGSGGRKTTLSSIAVSPSLRPLRVEMEPVVAANDFGTLGQAQGTANIQEIWLSDDGGRILRPFGYILRKEDGRQQFNILNGGELRNNVDLPLSEIQAGDRLYVYWQVPPGITIAAYHVGAAEQPIGFAVE